MCERPDRERITWRQRWAKSAARTRVLVSILLACSACVLARPTEASLLAGLPVALAGLGIRGWAAGHLRKNQELAVSGPYAHVRNPLYIGSLLAAAGLGICAAHAALLATVVAVFLLWFLPVVSEEEDHVRQILPGFREYETRVRRFVPSLSPRYRGGAAFDWQLYVSNREYSALLGFGAFAIVLWLKLVLL